MEPESYTYARSGVRCTTHAISAALLNASDFVSIHLVLSECSHHLINRVALTQMKPGALLINTSCATIVDQQAMIDALQTGQLVGADLEVFEQEPLSVDHPLRRLPDVLTPHLGYAADSNYHTDFTQAVGDLQGGDNRHTVAFVAMSEQQHFADAPHSLCCTRFSSPPLPATFISCNFQRESHNFFTVCRLPFTNVLAKK